jgi:iron complex transport system ATP-binding protein
MLKLEQLSCGYDSGFTVSNVDLSIGDGEILGIVGPNGSGKSTLLKAVTRMIKPISGRILLEGQDIWQMQGKDIAKTVAVVSQTSEAESMTVEDFVLLGRMPYHGQFQFLETKEDHNIAVRSMELTDCLRFKDHLISETSDGEKQLALFARALTQQPRVLILDEPTAHLDITHQVSIMDLVRRLSKEFGLTVIIVLHDLNLAAEYCHRLVLLSDGSVHTVGTPDEVIDYKIIEEVYKTVVVVDRNPISSKPFVLVVSEEEQRKAESASTSTAKEDAQKTRKGCLHVYTGEGKGKTTASIGLALRTLGIGKRVFIGQFIKGEASAEITALTKNFPKAEAECFGLGRFIRKAPAKDDLDAAQKGLDRLREILTAGEVDLVIADELSGALKAGVVSLDDVLSLTALRPAHVELVITGRDAHPQLVEQADLVTEMQKIKHYFDKGLPAREGIEY